VYTRRLNSSLSKNIRFPSGSKLSIEISTPNLLLFPCFSKAITLWFKISCFTKSSPFSAFFSIICGILSVCASLSCFGILMPAGLWLWSRFGPSIRCTHAPACGISAYMKLLNGLRSLRSVPNTPTIVPFWTKLDGATSVVRLFLLAIFGKYLPKVSIYRPFRWLPLASSFSLEKPRIKSSACSFA